jgi:hypothetical protein
MPHYDFKDFVRACGERGKVFVRSGAKDSAKRDFSLDTTQKILDFIRHAGLEDLCFFNTKPWENNLNPSDEILVDSYHFSSGTRYGYIAFLYIERTKKWLIKSFKLDSDSDPRNLPFADDPRLVDLRQELENNREEETDES